MAKSKKNNSRKNGVSRNKSSRRGHFIGFESIFGGSTKRRSTRKNSNPRKNSSRRGYYLGVESIFGRSESK